MKARLAAKGVQGPDLRDGIVDTSGCVSLRLPNLQAISLSVIKKWKLAGGRLHQGCWLRAPPEWEPPKRAVFRNWMLQRAS